jgi:hypothetical protein
MNQNLIQKLLYSYAGQLEAHSLPLPLKDSFQLISSFFSSNINNKLCLIFSSKEFATQWLAVPLTFNQISDDYNSYRDEITESYKLFRTGEKLILNNEAIVEWVRLKETEKGGITKKSALFRTKSTKGSASLEISIPFEKISKLQRTNKKVLSPQKKVMEVLPKKSITHLEDLLEVATFGNQEFVKSKTCLVTKYKSFTDSIDNVVINSASLEDYFPVGKIDENGTVDTNSPLLLANNLSTLALYSIANPIKKIIIDGFSAIHERGTDFSDIDVKSIPTILITDLSEIESFEFIGNYGFEFFNFTKENLNIDQHSGNSPFHAFNKKLKKYTHFNLIKEICHDNNLETITQKIHSIEKDDSNQDLNTLKINLIQLTNLASRICHNPCADEITSLNEKINAVDFLFQRNKMWLGDSHKPIDESISLLKTVIEKLITEPSDKCSRLKALMNKQNYDYIICPTADEAQALKLSLPEFAQSQILSIADVNDNLLTNKFVKALITGWAKSNNINRILSSFLFSELTLLFYQFENKYYNSLQRRNRKYNENIKSTISNKGIRSENDSQKSKGFDDLYSDDGLVVTTSESSFDILEFELKLDNAQYSKYRANGNLIESIKAKRVDFENDSFIYSSESHKFLVINELIEKHGEKANLHRKKLDTLKPGDVIALINTDRDILADLVEKNTNKQDLAAVKQWTDLWKDLLKEHFVSIGNDFKKLVEELRKNDCKKHEVTIRTWLQDENRIGPNDNADLISIALLTNSNLLNDNINTVREAIRKMTGWRMKASDFITDKIKAQIHEFADSSIVNQRILIEGLGSVIVLKVIEASNVWENIDVRYVNRILQKEII